VPKGPSVTESARCGDLEDVQVEIAIDVGVSQFSVFVQSQLVAAEQCGDDVFVLVEGVDRDQVLQSCPEILGIF
jgi:hypothetical protein